MTGPSSRRPAQTAAALGQLRALGHPDRYRVFENLLAEPRTARQMAQLLGAHPTRLYHHFRVLERAGLIRPAGTKQKRGATEKYFEAAVDRVEAPPAAAGEPLALALFEGVLGSTLDDVRRAPARGRGRRPAGASAPYLRRYRFRATPAQAAAIQARLEALAGLCEDMSAPAGAPEFGLTLAFYETPGRKRG